MCSHVEDLIKDREELKNSLRGILNSIEISSTPVSVNGSIDKAVNRIVLLIYTMLRQERVNKDDRTL